MRLARVLAAVGALSCLSVVIPAHAQEDLIAPPLPYATEVLPGPVLRRGLYVRGSLGLGGVWIERSLRPHDQPASHAATQALTGTFELSVGGAPIAGFAVAGSLFSSVAPGLMTTTRSDLRGHDGSLSLHMLALTLDWFPSLQSGAHLGGSLGVARVRLEGDTLAHDLEAQGPAIALMAGKDIWAGDTLAVGALGRFIAVAASERGDRRNEVSSPFLACTATLVLSVAYLGGR